MLQTVINKHEGITDLLTLYAFITDKLESTRLCCCTSVLFRKGNSLDLIWWQRKRGSSHSIFLKIYIGSESEKYILGYRTRQQLKPDRTQRKMAIDLNQQATGTIH